MGQGTQGMQGMQGTTGMTGAGQGFTPQTVSPFVQPPGSPTRLDKRYKQGFLSTQIGQNVRIEFLVGGSSLTDRMGQLLEVGVDSVVLREQETDDLIVCDIFSIRFVTIFK